MGVFISHAHEDAALAEGFVRLLLGRFHVPDGSLRCTSLVGYRLGIGGDASDTLRSELASSDIVIGLLTSSSVRSTWVISELGAAWGLDKTVALIVMPGVADADIPGPLSDLVRIDLRADGRRSPHLFADRPRAMRRMRDILDTIISCVDKSLTGSWTVKSGADSNELIEQFIDKSLKYSSLLRPHEAIETRETKWDRPHGMIWSEIAEYCQKDLRIWGWSCRNVFDGNSRSIFRDWLKGRANRRLRILVLDPKELRRSAFDFGPVCDTDNPTVVADIETSLEQWKEWRDACKFDNNKLEINVTNWVMCFSGVAIDMDSPDGVIACEYYSYKTRNHLNERPNLIVRKESRFWTGVHDSVSTLFGSGVSA